MARERVKRNHGQFKDYRHEEARRKNNPPVSLAPKYDVQQGKFQVTDWHLFQPKDDSRSRSVVHRGME